MNKRPIITIAGKLGSGKSSAAKAVAKKLGFQHFSSGDFARALAAERGVTITELMKTAEADPSIDHLIDERLREFIATHENFVIDSRLAYHWAPESFKVYLEIDPEVAADRMFADLASNEDRKKSEDYQDKNEMYQKMLDRFNGDQKRYYDLYGVDHSNHSSFDLVIDSGKPKHNLDFVVDKILQDYQNWLTS